MAFAAGPDQRGVGAAPGRDVGRAGDHAVVHGAARTQGRFAGDHAAPDDGARTDPTALAAAGGRQYAVYGKTMSGPASGWRARHSFQRSR
jgi:hypothetical protein